MAGESRHEPEQPLDERPPMLHDGQPPEDAQPDEPAEARQLSQYEIAERMGLILPNQPKPWWRGGRFSRRGLLKGAGVVAVGGAVLAAGGGAWLKHQADQVNEAEVSINSLLDEVIGGIMTEAQFKAAAAQCGDVILDLDEEQRIAGDAGHWLTIFEAVFGTSNNFRWGLDNAGGPNNQPNAIPQIGAESLDSQALAILRIVQIITKVFAHPGAYSGNGPYPHTDVGAQDSVAGGQLHYNQHGYNFQQDIRQNPAKPIVRYEGGYDDYRVLFSSVSDLASRLSDIRRMASTTLSQDMQNEVVRFLGSMDGVAAQFGRNLIMFADNLAEANDDRLQNGLMRITMEVVFTWNFVRQRFFPFSAVDGDNAPLLNNPFLGALMQPDPTGPPDLGRYLVDTQALPGGIGPKLAFIAWAKIVQQQINALRTIAAKHPRLHRLITDLIDANKMPNFYAAPVYEEATATPTPTATADAGQATSPGEIVDGGHPGSIPGRRGGAENIALEGLRKRKRTGADGKVHTFDEHSSLRDLPAA